LVPFFQRRRTIQKSGGRGGVSNVVGIICPSAALVQIGLNDLPKPRRGRAIALLLWHLCL